jgi:hypothetical protein
MKTRSLCLESLLTLSTAALIASPSLAQIFPGVTMPGQNPATSTGFGSEPAYCSNRTFSPRRSVAMPVNQSIGNYLRFSPDGRYMLSTNYGVELVDLTATDASGKVVPKVTKTPMAAEAFPVDHMGNWKYIASPHRYEAMKYFDFEEALRDGQSARPPKIKNSATGAEEDFSDSKFVNYYHSTGELAGSTQEKGRFRVSLFQELKYRDIEVNYGSNGKGESVTYGDIKVLCPNLPRNDSIYLSSPTLSKDGSEVAFNVSSNDPQNQGTHIYKIDADGNCQLSEKLGYATGKVVFSYPQDGTKGKLIFQAGMPSAMGDANRPSGISGSGIYTYDRDTKTTTLVSREGEGGGMVGSNYPGFLKDGSAVYVENSYEGNSRSNTSRVVFSPPSNHTNKQTCAFKKSLSNPTLAAHLNGAGPNRTYARFIALVGSIGQGWYQRCQPDALTDISKSDLANKVTTLSAEACASMVNDGAYASQMLAADGLTFENAKDMLLATCASLNCETGEGAGAGTQQDGH